MQQTSISSVALDLCAKIVIELCVWKLFWLVQRCCFFCGRGYYITPLPINLLHIFGVFLRVIYRNIEHAMKAYIWSVVPNAIFDICTHTNNKAQSQSPRENLIRLPLLKRFLGFYRKWKFITVFTRARLCAIHWATSVHSITLHNLSHHIT
jgi:hypothetical protein